MVTKVFWQNPYQTELETRIHSVAGNRVSLDETIFFAFSGGQESDHGFIAGRAVRAAEKKGNQIFYELETTDGLDAGDPVSVSIHWPRRQRLMRLHFAAELILEMVYQNHPGTCKAGAHIAEDKARIDFEWEGNISELFSELSAQFATIISEDRPILCDFSDPAQERWFWKIEGFAEVPCGGTHVKRTGEIGEINLKRKNPGKGKERIEITLVKPDPV